jgi:hypothetical protein
MDDNDGNAIGGATGTGHESPNREHLVALPQYFNAGQC